MDRPERLNAFSEELYLRVTSELLRAGDDDGTAVVVLTGSGRAFSAGADLEELGRRSTGSGPATAAFDSLVDGLAAFPKPIVAAVNGLAVGFGATLLGLVDLVVMSAAARVKYPFTELGLSPEAGGSFTLPALVGRHDATWALLSSEWLTAAACLDIGLAWRVIEPDLLVKEAMRLAAVIGARPIGSLVATKRLIAAASADALAQARRREDASIGRLLGGAENRAALAALSARSASV